MNYVYLTTLLLLGLLLIISYVIYIKNIDTVKPLWGKANETYKNIFFYISLSICSIAFILTLIYISNNNKLSKSQINNLFLGLFGIVLMSLYWLPLTLLHLNYNNSRTLTMLLILFTLFIVALSSAYVSYIIYKIDDKSYFKIIILIGMIYFTFHTLVLDFIYWSYAYFIQF